MPTPRVVILHGWENRRPPEHWEHILADDLRARGYRVDYPQLPDPDTPDLDAWLRRLSDLVDGADHEPVTLVVHSLAASLWLTRLARGAGPGDVTRVAVVAIPAPSVLAGTVVAPFTDHPARIAAIPGVDILVVEGEGDPYAPGGVAASYAIDPGISVEVVAGGGHLIPDTGFGEWPGMLAWVLDSLGTEPRSGMLNA